MNVDNKPTQENGVTIESVSIRASYTVDWQQRAEQAEVLLREMTSYANILSQTVDLVGKGVSTGVYPSTELVKAKVAEALAFLATKGE